MNKVVLISGADGGMGQAIIENLKNHGYKLSLGTLDPEKLEVQLGIIAGLQTGCFQPCNCRRLDI